MVSFSSQNEMSFLYQLLQSHNRSHRKKDHHDHAQHDPVITKYLKVILSDVAHQEFDGVHRHYKCDHHTGDQVKQLQPCKVEAELHQL